MTGYVYGASPVAARPAVVDDEPDRPRFAPPARTAKAGLIPLRLIVVHGHNVRRNLGDLRELTASIARHGLLVPLSLERYGDRYRIRDGHRRYAAAKLAGLSSVLAVVHGEALEDEEWVVEAVQVNHHRRSMSRADRRDAVLRLRESRMPWSAIAAEFGVSVSAVQRWAKPPTAGKAPLAQRGERDQFERALSARLLCAGDWLGPVGGVRS